VEIKKKKKKQNTFEFYAAVLNRMHFSSTANPNFLRCPSE